MQNYSLRRANPQDLDFVIDLIDVTFKDIYIKNGGSWNLEEQLSEWRNKLKTEVHNIIMHDQNDIGLYTIQESDDSIYLDLLFILPEFQGNGVARAILNDLITKGKDVTLRTLESNDRATAFFQKFGFVFEKEEDKRIYMRYKNIFQI